MSFFQALKRETGFTLRDRTVLLCMLFLFCLSSLSLGFGMAEVQQQKASIAYLKKLDEQDRNAELAKQKSWGSAAYYSFHLTYDPPSGFAFAALGQRDLQPWKHRIRMLALEGQIYERDAGNPVIALIGRFDFAFLTAFVLPLVLIILLYDLKACERAAGRLALLESMAGGANSLWWMRASLRVILILLCLVLPLIVAGVMQGTSLSTLLLASMAIVGYAVFWTVLCVWVAMWSRTGAVLLTSLIGCWLLLAVILPAGMRLMIDKAIPVPSGAEILLLQRETVNDAWDLPRDLTFIPFFEQHPEWSDYVAVDDGFEWQWYYAFQQVGDQGVEKLSQAYREGRLARDRLAARLSWLAPPSLIERVFQSLAHTSLQDTVAYEDSVRAFHSELRAFYYPKFFRNRPFESSGLQTLPQFRSKE